MLEVTVEGMPIPWARPRFNGGRAFTHPNQLKAKLRLKSLLKSQWPKGPVEGSAMLVELTFLYRARRKADLGSPKVTRPDGDNLAKLVLDAANGILWTDDSQVTDLRICKKYGPAAATIIKVRALS